MHITRLTVKRLVLQACWWFGGCSQFALDSRPGERLNGAHAGPGLEHRLVLCTCRFGQEAARSVPELLCAGSQEFTSGICFPVWKGRLVNFPQTLIKVENPVKSHSGKSYAFHLICVWLEWRFELGIKNGSRIFDVVQLNYIVLFVCFFFKNSLPWLSLRMTPALFYIWQADLEKSGKGGKSLDVVLAQQVISSRLFSI